ncbi:hypothetical protein IWQ56_002430 [Coemansia nantahalensis]|nr:hypothetical protein IWQ56_002430 [Coemansia nantahalensis]
MPPAHTSIFEIGGEPFSKSPAPPSRLGRAVGPANGGALSTTTSPVGLRPLGSLMGSPHILFNDPAAAPLPPAPPHGVPQARFGGGPARTGEHGADAAVGQSILDMSNGLLDTMQSQQASPSNGAQPGLSEFYVKSLPVSRRNSREFQSLWQELEGFTIGDNATHMSAFDGHPAAARPAATNLGTSPKLPHGLLDDDVLSVLPKHAPEALGQPSAPAANGAPHSHVGPGRHRIASVADLTSVAGQPALGVGAPPAPGYGANYARAQPAYPHDGQVGFGAYAGAPQTHRPSITGADRHPGDAGRAAALIRNASTPSLGANHYQGMRMLDNGAHAASAARADMQAAIASNYAYGGGQPFTADVQGLSGAPAPGLYPGGASVGPGVPGNQQQQQQHGAHHHQKHQHGKSFRKGDTEPNRFTNVPLEDLKGTIFDVCKDQHGCRYLQKKLEDGQEGHVDLIFCEALPHFSLLMTDPFGNYLCQKLLEFCTEAQRTRIVATVAPDLVNVSLNMHGTRAVQKMIDSLSNQEQIDTVIGALRSSVVVLIRDLNGNHVIQKCLCRLSGANNQFIYDSVAASCTDVATHRHGCCVFQRCIDHATRPQKTQLVNVVIAQALTLVQDPFGNYVVQYVLDLNVPEYLEPLVQKFVDHICALSVQKFSSNVMEKCIRQASPATRRLLVAPLLQRDTLDMLMRDSYGNYVVQTALDYADPHQRLELIESILPLLPLIRSAPYGKRIYNKLQRDGFISAVPSAAGSRHASPTLGPSHGAHPPPAMASVALYPPIVHPAAVAAGPGAVGMAAAPGLSRGTSPSANGTGAAPAIAQSRAFVANGAFQRHPQQLGSNGAPYYFMDAAASLGHPGASAPMMVPAHPGLMTPVANGVYDHLAPAVTSSAPPSARARMSPANYGAN